MKTSRCLRVRMQRDGERFPPVGMKWQVMEAAVMIQGIQRERKLLQVTRTASRSRKVTGCVRNYRENLQTPSLAVRNLLTKTVASRTA